MNTTTSQLLVREKFAHPVKKVMSKNSCETHTNPDPGTENHEACGDSMTFAGQDKHRLFCMTRLEMVSSSRYCNKTHHPGDKREAATNILDIENWNLYMRNCVIIQQGI